MATTTSHNKKSSAVKRILSEAREMEADESTEYQARPLEDNIFEWHFTVRGPRDSEYEKGIYHGRILLPSEYPFRPPNLMLLTPNGRWECNKKICLSFTGFHEDTWQPAWGIRTALLGVQSFMAARAEAATGVGSLDYPIEERRRLAEKSPAWACPDCGETNESLLPQQDERKEEQLPEGLSIDPSSEQRRQQEQEHDDKQAEASGSASDATATPAMPSTPPQPSSPPSSTALVPPPAPAAQQQEVPQLRTPPPPPQVATRASAVQQPVNQHTPDQHPLLAQPRPAIPVAPNQEPLPPPPLPPPPPRQPTRSEARVAQLDRAILTVVLLLCGLVARRLL